MISDLVSRNRSFRRFKQSPAVQRTDLEAWVDLARRSSSGGNLQPLAYYLSADGKTNDAIFHCLRWAGYLKDWPGPAEGERPTGYLVICRNNEITQNFLIDHGIAAEIIRLAALEKGFGSCIMGSINRPMLRQATGIPNTFEILVVIAVGAPGEKVVLEEARDGNIHYWRDAEGVMHVPKRPLKDVLIN
jgi:nitroreductase